jgi:Ca-activated chloride channel family protein
MNDLWTQLDPGFLQPIWLAVGFVAVIAIVLIEFGARRQRNQAVRQFAASHLVASLTRSVSPIKRYIKRALLIFAVALLFIAMARPHLLDDWREENRTGLDVLIAVDCSKSMLTQDIKPSRLERAKLALADFSDRLPNTRLGLIAFAGDAFLQCPLTFDHDAFDTAVRELDTDTIPKPGTDIAVAIHEAVEALHSQSSNAKFLILVTDGEDLEERGIEAAKEAAQAGLRIYTVGVGTPDGDLIPERDDAGNVTYHHDASGQIVQSKLDEGTLRQIASVTGGAYVPLGQNGEGLDEIYNRYIATLPQQLIEERREKIQIERFEWPLSLAILFLMLEFMLKERAKLTPVAPLSPGPNRRAPRRRATRNAVATVPLLALALLVVNCPVRASNTDKAESDYKSGKYDDAAQNYQQATQSQPDRNDIVYDLGDANYKAGKYTDAEDAFQKSLHTPDLGLQENAYFNLGNAQFKHGEALQKVDTQKTIDLWEKALKSYTSSLALRKSADAKHNYDIVKAMLDQLKKQQQQDQQNKKDGQSKPNDKDQQGKDSKGNNGKDPNEQNKPGNDQNKDQSPQSNSQQPQPGDKPGQDKPSDSTGQDKNGQQQQQSAGNPKDDSNLKTYSGTRGQDKVDPGVKSREEAEALLDSLKDDEHHITARVLNGNNEQPPPPPSGKDW